MWLTLRVSGCFTGLVLLVAACELAPPEMGLLPEDQAAIEELAETYVEAAMEGDWGRVAALFREDAALLPPEQPAVEGRGNISEALQPPPGVELTIMTLGDMEIEGGPFVAFARGTFVQQFVADTPDGPIQWTEEGSWLSVLRRDTTEPGEGWGILRHIWNSDVASPPID